MWVQGEKYERPAGFRKRLKIRGNEGYSPFWGNSENGIMMVGASGFLESRLIVKTER